MAAGAILHDIGRVLEYGGEATAPSVTVPGRLAGHLLLGRDLVRDAARALGDSQTRNWCKSWNTSC